MCQDNILYVFYTDCQDIFYVTDKIPVIFYTYTAALYLASVFFYVLYVIKHFQNLFARADSSLAHKAVCEALSITILFYAADISVLAFQRRLNFYNTFVPYDSIRFSITLSAFGRNICGQSTY